MKAMFDVIKYNGDNNILVHRYPLEDFNTKSQLIVQQSQEAVFYSGGQLADTFTEGTYTLDTKNLPILSTFVNLPFGKTSPFSAVIYFINKTEQININWGIQNVNFIEPEFGTVLKVGAHGSLTFRVENTVLFLSKLIGQKDSFTQAETMSFMQNFIDSCGQNRLATLFNTRTDFNILTIETQINTISVELKKALSRDFSEYGLQLERFLVTGINKNEDSIEYKTLLQIRREALNRASITATQETQRVEQIGAIKISNETSRLVQENDLHLDEQRRLHEMKLGQQEQAIAQDLAARGLKTDAEAMGYKRSVEGYTYQQERGFDVAEKTAENESAASFSGPALGIAAMGATAGVVGGLYADALSQTAGAFTQQQKSTDSSSEFESSFDMFGNVGLEQTEDKDRSSDKTELEADLITFQKWFNAGLITEEEYQQKRSEILAKF